MFRRRRDGRIRVRLATRDRRLIAQLPDLIADAADADDIHDPGHEILHRPAFRDDPEASEAFAELVEGDADRRRRHDAEIARRVGEGDEVLEHADAHALLRVLNEARLVLAARAGAFERGSGWEREVPNDPNLAVVAWLGYVQSDLVEALMRR